MIWDIKKDDSMGEDFMAVQKKPRKFKRKNTILLILLEVIIKTRHKKTKKFKNNNYYNVNIFELK